MRKMFPGLITAEPMRPLWPCNMIRPARILECRLARRIATFAISSHTAPRSWEIPHSARHISTNDFFAAIDSEDLPAVSFVKPDGLLDGHPASSKLDLFEAMVKKIMDHLTAKPELMAETAFIITFDEGGGYYDSGYIQPLDFFGDGPRIPLIIVSAFSKGGRVNHTYADHVSILKFIERNWNLKPLTGRSRDNLPNPVSHKDNVYVPQNSPAIGDLFDMFDFGHDNGRGQSDQQGEK